MGEKTKRREMERSTTIRNNSITWSEEKQVLDMFLSQSWTPWGPDTSPLGEAKGWITLTWRGQPDPLTSQPRRSQSDSDPWWPAPFVSPLDWWVPKDSTLEQGDPEPPSFLTLFSSNISVHALHAQSLSLLKCLDVFHSLPLGNRELEESSLFVFTGDRCLNCITEI